MNKENPCAKQGEWVYYDASGQVRLKESYNMDVLHGPAVTLSKNGKRPRKVRTSMVNAMAPGRRG